MRKVTIKDAKRICEIYNHYVLNTTVTFDTELFTLEMMENKIRNVLNGGYDYWVYELDGLIVGFCHLNQWKPRNGYRFTAEISIYVDKEFVGRGIGVVMMKYLLEHVDITRIRSILSCISLPNDSSVRVHEKFGFKQAGLYRKIGFKLGEWRDVGYWQLNFDE
jgi:L-amino acid N-acyltransferase YncA